MSRRLEGERTPPRRLGAVSQLISDKANALDKSDARNTEALIIPVERIHLNPRQPRKVLDPERDRELAENIAENGILEPLIVREVAEGQYEIVAGERRYRAADQAGLKVVPVIVKDYDDKQAQFVAAIENLQRQDLDPADEAAYFKFLAENYNYSYRKIGEMVHRSPSYVNQRMRLLNLGDATEGELEPAKASEKSNKRAENRQKLEKSQAAGLKYSPRPMLNFGGWLDKTGDNLPRLKTEEVAELRDKLAELKHKIAELERKLK